jgi:uncharacterized membrane protein
MPLLRLAYSTLYLVALIAVYVLWSQVGGQSHLDLLPWHVKLALGVLTALAVVRATAAAVAGERGWNAQSLRWLGLALALLIGCGLASYYSHVYLEDSGDESDSQADTTVSSFHRAPQRDLQSSVRLASARRRALSAPASATTTRSPS